MTYKIGMITGTFDLYHLGHLNWIRKCKQFVDDLWIGMDTDQLARERKGADRPVCPYAERWALVDALPEVEGVFPLNHPRDLKARSADILFKPVGWTADMCDRVYQPPGSTIVYIDEDPNLPTTTQIIERIRNA